MTDARKSDDPRDKILRRWQLGCGLAWVLLIGTGIQFWSRAREPAPQPNQFFARAQVACRLAGAEDRDHLFVAATVTNVGKESLVWDRNFELAGNWQIRDPSGWSELQMGSSLNFISTSNRFVTIAPGKSFTATFNLSRELGTLSQGRVWRERNGYRREEPGLFRSKKEFQFEDNTNSITVFYSYSPDLIRDITEEVLLKYGLPQKDGSICRVPCQSNEVTIPLPPAKQKSDESWNSP